MNIFTNTKDKAALEKLKSFLGDHINFAENPGEADGLILIREVGKDPLASYNGNPTILIAGAEDAKGRALIRRAVAAGISQNMIISCKPGGVLSLEDAAILVKDAIENAKQDVMDTDVALGEGNIIEVQEDEIKETAVKEPVLESNVVETSTFTANTLPVESRVSQDLCLPEINVCILSYMGGVGRTLLSSSLSAIFTARGYRVALVDLSRHHYTLYHMGLPDLVEQGNGSYARTRWGDLIIQKPSQTLSEIAQKLGGYKVAIYDFPLGIPPGWEQLLKDSCRVLVVNHDMRTLAYTKEQLGMSPLEDYLLVANKIPQVSVGSYGKVVANLLGKEPVEIPMESDIEAYVADYSPATTQSRILEVAIEKLADSVEAFIRRDVKGEGKCA